jgi:hypothetical protein
MRFMSVDSAHHPDLINHLSKYLVMAILKCISLKNKMIVNKKLPDLLEAMDVIDGLNKCDVWASIADKLEIALAHITKLGDMFLFAGDSQDDELISDSVGNTNFMVIDDEDGDKD